MKILLIEDDKLFGECIQCGLSCYHYDVEWVKDGLAAWSFLQTKWFDMVILDLNLPKLSGEEVLKRMRSKNITTAVIVISGCCSFSNRAKVLNIGADDYICKPFKLEELCARIRAIQRRAILSCTQSTVVIGGIALDTAARRVFKFGKEIKIYRREFELLQILMKNTGRIVSRKMLLHRLYYGGGTNIDSNTLEVHIHNLRKKIGRDMIATYCGEGYALNKN